jgi:hypothetical protein
MMPTAELPAVLVSSKNCKNAVDKIVKTSKIARGTLLSLRKNVFEVMVSVPASLERDGLKFKMRSCRGPDVIAVRANQTVRDRNIIVGKTARCRQFLSSHKLLSNSRRLNSMFLS